jgi:transcription termination factor NusB
MATKEFQQHETFWNKWGAVVILTAFFVLSWFGQFVSQLQSEQLIAQQHGQAFELAEFWPEFFSSTFENWQSEWLQLVMQAILLAGFSSYLFRKQNEEHYKTQQMIDELRRQLPTKKS